MRQNVSVVPTQPLPHVPPTPQEPQRLRVQPPTVFVYERERWEYKVISQTTADNPHVVEEALNALGKDGWELVATVPLSNVVQFYLKRPRGGSR